MIFWVLVKTRLIKVILLNNWSILISYELIFVQLLIPLKNNLHLSFSVFQSNPIHWIQKKKHIFGYRACLQVKGRTFFSKKSDYRGKAAIFFNVHASCTVSMCHVKLPKGTNYTIKKITIKIKSHQDDGRMLLFIIILGFDLKWLLQLKH